MLKISRIYAPLGLLLVWALTAPGLQAQEVQLITDLDAPREEVRRHVPLSEAPGVREAAIDQDAPGLEDAAARLNPVLDLGVQALDTASDQDADQPLRAADLEARLAAPTLDADDLDNGRGDGAPLPRLGLAATPPLSADELDNGRGDGAPLPRLGLAATPPLSADELDNGRGDFEEAARPSPVLEAEAETAEVAAQVLAEAVEAELPEGLSLSSNYPNPFNPSTEIGFTLHQQGHATLKVFDVAGREVATLFDGAAQAGQPYTVTFDAKDLASGLYLYRLTINGLVVQKKMLLTK